MCLYARYFSENSSQLSAILGNILKAFYSNASLQNSSLIVTEYGRYCIFAQLILFMRAHMLRGANPHGFPAVDTHTQEFVSLISWAAGNRARPSQSPSRQTQ